MLTMLAGAPGADAVAVGGVGALAYLLIVAFFGRSRAGRRQWGRLLEQLSGPQAWPPAAGPGQGATHRPGSEAADG